MRASVARACSAPRERLYRIVFGLAALYNLAFGLWAALFPAHFFVLCGVAPPSSPALWQCIGMMVGVYAPAYLYAALRPWAARPLIAVALLGKLLGPVGWLLAVRAGHLPVATFPLVAMNDIAWWAPFVLFLVDPTRLGACIRAAVPSACALFHAAAALWTAVFLRNALYGAPEERLRFIEAHVGIWRAGWALWMVAAVSFVAFIAWWAARVGGAVAIIAFVAAVFGLASDIAADATYIGWLPARGATVFEVGRVLSLGLAHTGYVVAGTLLTFADRSLSVPLRRLATCIWAAGALAELGALMESHRLTDVLFGFMFALLVPWMVLVGRARKHTLEPAFR